MITLVDGALNYRCLRYVSRPLQPFHVLVGPNASGKTTFLDVVGFLQDLLSEVWTQRCPVGPIIHRSSCSGGKAKGWNWPSRRVSRTTCGSEPRGRSWTRLGTRWPSASMRHNCSSSSRPRNSCSSKTTERSRPSVPYSHAPERAGVAAHQTPELQDRGQQGVWWE